MHILIVIPLRFQKSQAHFLHQRNDDGPRRLL